MEREREKSMTHATARRLKAVSLLRAPCACTLGFIGSINLHLFNTFRCQVLEGWYQVYNNKKENE